MKQRGFTLIEIVVALGIFAILASLTSYIMLQSFRTDERLKTQSQRLHQFEMTITLMRREIAQIINRPVRGNNQALFPAFIGHADNVEFTRSGAVNPGALEQRSTLKRIAYLCYGHTLIRRTWNTLDSPDRNQFHDKILFDHLKKCAFSYTNRKHASLTEWKIIKKKGQNTPAKFPISITAHLSTEQWGTTNLVFVIPVGLYA
ncbi:MAG: type II secretion system minor pseudopilin GspJ [Gammaproteobacteria bacterium]|nr:type II secretion system minor pseudopilin GspJ [Gammaproteobacteria bacterium]